MTTPNDSRDFYPTPDNLAWEMAYSLQSTKYGWKHLPQPILEPSAGDGALARQIHAVADIRHDPKTGELDRYSTSKAKEFDLDCVELSSDFRAKLKKDGFRVVHDDFLTFRPAKKYAAIINDITDGMAKGRQRLAEAGVKCVSLTDLDTIAQVGVQQGYITQGDVARLLAFRDDPSDENWIRKGE